MLVAKGEGGRDRQRLGDAGTLDHQIVEAAPSGERAHLLQQIVAKRAADAAIGHLDQAFLGAGQRRFAAPHEVGVNVDLRHVVDDDGDTPALAVRKDVVQQGGLPCSEKPRQDRHWQTIRKIRHNYYGP